MRVIILSTIRITFHKKPKMHFVIRYWDIIHIYKYLQYDLYHQILFHCMNIEVLLKDNNEYY